MAFIERSAGITSTFSIANFATPTNNFNSWAADSAALNGFVNAEGLYDGFYVRAIPGLDQIEVRYASAKQNRGDGFVGGGFVKIDSVYQHFQYNSTTLITALVQANPNPTILHHLVCWKFDFNNPTRPVLVIVEGGVGADPDIDTQEAANSGFRWLPICRIKKTNTILAQADIEFVGQTTYNVNESIRPLVSYNATSVKILTSAERASTTLNDASIFLNRDSANDGSLRIFDASQNKDIPIKSGYQAIWSLTSPLALGTYSATSTGAGAGFNPVYVKIARVAPATPFEDILNGVPGTGSLTFLANSLQIGDTVTIRGQISSTYTGYVSTGSPSVGYQLRMFMNDRTVAANLLNPLLYRYSSTASTQGNNLTIATVVISASQTSGFSEALLHQFELRGIITAVGASGKIKFLEHGDFYQINGAAQPVITVRASKTTQCETATINTTINNNLIFDFDVIRIPVGSGFNPTVTLTDMQITKN